MTPNFLKLKGLAEASTLSARIRELGTAPESVKVLEATPRTCIIQSDLREGAEVWITLGALPPVRGTIIEAAQGFAECEFYSPIDAIRLQGNRPISTPKSTFKRA